MQQEKKYPDLQTKIIEEEITRRWNSLTHNPEGIMTRESLREGVVRDMLINGQLSKEADIIFKIVEQWGNAACPMTVMEQWLKDYAVAQRPAGGNVWVKCSDRLPGYETPVKWRDGNDHSHVTDGKIPLIHMAKPFLTGWEWYDEFNEQPVEQKKEEVAILRWLREEGWEPRNHTGWAKHADNESYYLTDKELWNEYQKLNP